MAFRGGRGRGRGFGGGSSYNSTPQAFKLFPEDVALPDRNKVPLDADFYTWNHKLQVYFENSAYFVEESATQDCQNHDIERYSDSLKPRNKLKRNALSDFMKLKPGYFPRELVKGAKVNSQKKVKWNPALDTKRLDFFEQLEKNAKEKGDKEHNSDSEDKSDSTEEDDGEYSDDGDYAQNEDFDDDEDDFNDDKDGGDDEPFY